MELVRQATTHMGFNYHDWFKNAGIEHRADANDVTEMAYAAADWKSR